MGLFKNPFKSKRKRAGVRPPSKLFLKMESIEEMVTEIAARLDAMLAAKLAGQQGEVWEKFQAYSELTAAIEAAQAARTAASEQASGFEQFEAFDTSGEEAVE